MRRSKGQKFDQLHAVRIAVAWESRQRQAMLMQLHQQIAEVDRRAQAVADILTR
jgi:hypothetical protein